MNGDYSGSRGGRLHRREHPDQAIQSVLTDYVFSFYLLPNGEFESEWRSDGVLRISGYSAEDIERIGWLQVVHPEDRHILTERLAHVRKGQSPVIEYRIITRAGETRWIREFNRAIWSQEERRYSRFVGSAQDITEERLAEITRGVQLRVMELIASGADPDLVFSEIVSLVKHTYTDTDCAIHVRNNTRCVLRCFSDGFPGEIIRPLKELQLNPVGSPQAEAVVSQQTVVIPDCSNDHRWPELAQRARESGFASLLVVPISSRRGESTGTISVYQPRIGAPSPEELERVTLAARLAGFVIDNSVSEKALRDREIQYRALFDNNPNVVFSLDVSGRIQHINPATLERTGYRTEDLIGRQFISLVVPGEYDRAWRNVRDSLEGEPRQFETEIVTRRGSHVPISVTSVPWIIDGVVAGVSVIAEDISDRVRLEKELVDQAFHDGLTGLPNRALFNERLSQALASTSRFRDWVAVLFIELDNFKVVNDSLGHECGDEYLKVIASLLEGCVGSDEMVARFGGNEFTVLLYYPASDPTYPVRVARRIGTELARTVLIRGYEINSGTSIGIAIQSAETDVPSDLLKQAAIALYQAKRAESDTSFRVFESSMKQQVVERMEIERDLRRAIKRNEFEVHYQPIIDLQSEQIVMVEALVRWRHPERGLLPPVWFLPIAENTGQISEIDALVLQLSTHEIGQWNRSLALPDQRTLLLSINLSARDFRNPDLLERLQAILSQAEFDPRLLMFEITESTMMQDVASAFEVLVQLRDMGIGFSIDDFGTGYSSLAYLQRLPIDTLKIDRSFVDGLGGDADDELIVRTMINLASSLSLEVVAEGIETVEQLERARELGCDRAQGYFISRPVPFPELMALLKEQSRGDLMRFLG